MQKPNNFCAKKRDQPNTSLLVIDVQRGQFQKSTPIYRAAELLHTIGLLVQRAHECFAPVVYIQHANKSDLAPGSDGWQLHPALQPGGDDLIILKQHGSAFEKTNLEEALDARQVGTVLVTGLVTHGCVKATCLGAQALGYRVILAADGHSSYHRGAAQLIEEWNCTLAKAGVEIVSSAQVQF